MNGHRSEPFLRLPAYAVAHIARRKREMLASGVDVIDLGAGDSDLPPPPEVITRAREAVGQPEFGGYGYQLGAPGFRERIAQWMLERFGVSLDPATEILPLIGSKEGIAHLPLALLDPGDTTVIPDPAYPPYRGGTLLAGGEPWAVPLRPENDFLIPLDELPGPVVERLRILYLNYPNNPTAAVAPPSYLEDAVRFCRSAGSALLHDHAYSEFGFDGYQAPSILEVEGAKDVAIEFHSFSKTYNMTGWRLGWAAGSADLIAALTRLKTFMDTGAYMALQAAGMAALDVWETWVPRNRDRFQSRRDAVVAGLQEAGFDAALPAATLYVWVPLPRGWDSDAAFAEAALEQQAVAVLPGSSMGEGGEGYFRIALTVSEERLAEAARRLGMLRAGS